MNTHIGFFCYSRQFHFICTDSQLCDSGSTGLITHTYDTIILIHDSRMLQQNKNKLQTQRENKYDDEKEKKEKILNLNKEEEKKKG